MTEPTITSKIADHPITLLLSRFSSLIVIPILAWLGVTIWDTQADLGKGQTTINIEIAKIEQSLHDHFYSFGKDNNDTTHRNHE